MLILRELFDFIGTDKIYFIVTGSILLLHPIVRNYFAKEKRYQAESLLSLINYFDNKKKQSSFILEQLMMNRFKVCIPHRGIKLFLNTNDPTRNILDYKQGQKYLDFSESYNRVEYVNQEKHLIFAHLRGWFLYIIFGGVGVLMLLSASNIVSFDYNLYFPWCFLALYFCLLGYMGIDSTFKVVAAKRLVERLK